MPVVKLVPGPSLANLIAACETTCVSECCAMAAFGFSPLRIAAHLSKYTGSIAAGDVRRLLEAMDRLVSSANGLKPNAQGFVCSVVGTNPLFSFSPLQALVARIAWAMQVAPPLLARSDELVEEYEAGHPSNGGGP